MKKLFALITLTLLLFAPLGAKLRVVTTAGWLSDLVFQIGKDKVTVVLISDPRDDPHQILPLPSYIAATRNADAVVYNGLFLEGAYLPKVVESSRNRKVRPGAPGDIDCSAFVPRILEKAGSVGFVSGDEHPYGNPHYHLNPENIPPVVTGLAKRLGKIDPQNQDFYTANAGEFRGRLEAKIREWQAQSKILHGEKLLEYHKMFEYLIDFTWMKLIGVLEPASGIPPSLQHLGEIIELAKQEKPRVLLTTCYFEDQSVKKVGRMTGVPYFKVPHDVGTLPELKTYIDLMDYIIGNLHKIAGEGR